MILYLVLACTTCQSTEYETQACAGTDNRECTGKFKMHHKIQHDLKNYPIIMNISNLWGLTYS